MKKSLFVLKEHESRVVGHKRAYSTLKQLKQCNKEKVKGIKAIFLSETAYFVKNSIRVSYTSCDTIKRVHTCHPRGVLHVYVVHPSQRSQYEIAGKIKGSNKGSQKRKKNTSKTRWIRSKIDQGKKPQNQKESKSSQEQSHMAKCPYDQHVPTHIHAQSYFSQGKPSANGIGQVTLSTLNLL